jgi:Ca2+-binding EF-hand superfamily protein
MDANGDGKITREELRVGGKGKPGQNLGPDPAKLFEQFDTNKDGKLEASELPERLAKSFTQLDTNGDGGIDLEEAKAMQRIGQKPEQPGAGRSAMLLERFDMFDTDGDGKVLISELPEPIQKFLGRADADKDGFITKEEVTRIAARGPGGAAGAVPMSPESLLQNFDGNNDGKLSKDELTALPPGFPVARLDANGDGELTKEEIESKIGELRKMAGMRKKMVDRYNGKDPAARARALFEKFDADADGRVTRDEAGGELNSQFDKLDADKDGQLSPTEVENGLVIDPNAPSQPPIKKPKKKDKVTVPSTTPGGPGG